MTISSLHFPIMKEKVYSVLLLSDMNVRRSALLVCFASQGYTGLVGSCALPLDHQIG
jgi:hypothetical protein